jgi:hypothetical protein
MVTTGTIRDQYCVLGPDGEAGAPQHWHERHWERPYYFLTTLSRRPRPEGVLARKQWHVGDQLIWWTDVEAATTRASLTGSVSREMPRETFNSLVRAAYRALALEPWMFGCVITRTVEGWPDYAWTLENSPRRLDPRSEATTDSDVAAIAQGQVFLTGPGTLFAFGINWPHAEQAGVDPDWAYAHALVTVGRIGHAVLLEGQHHGLGARMTPAVHESRAAEVFDLDESRDVLYVIKLAYPPSR